MSRLHQGTKSDGSWCNGFFRLQSSFSRSIPAFLFYDDDDDDHEGDDEKYDDDEIARSSKRPAAVVVAAISQAPVVHPSYEQPIHTSPLQRYAHRSDSARLINIREEYSAFVRLVNRKCSAAHVNIRSWSLLQTPLSLFDSVGCYSTFCQSLGFFCILLCPLPL